MKLQPYRKTSVAVRSFSKLAAKYYDPYLGDAKLGEVDYRLLLLVDVLIHPIIHVSQLKNSLEVPSSITQPPVV